MDKLIVDSNGNATISNDGATIIKLLDIIHPAARTLVDIAKAQDAEVGDGTTSVVLLAGELLKLAKPFIEEGVAPQIIIKGYRQACELALQRIHQIAVSINAIGKSEQEWRTLLERCASTSLNSKLIRGQQEFFSHMVVNAVLSLDQRELDEKMIGIKKVNGGALQDSQLVDGVAFEKTFSYAGFEQQPKSFDSPRILLLNLELELKAERDNAEVRIEHVSEYQKIVDAEWTILMEKLDRIVASGANVVLSKLAIGDLATQYFADRGMFAAGRVPDADLTRMQAALGCAVHTTVNDLQSFLKQQKHLETNISSNLSDTLPPLGTCQRFEEKQVGEKRYNFFYGCTAARTCTLILRGGAGQFIAEVERSLHDAIMIVRRAIRNQEIVAGGGAIEMELARYLRERARGIEGKSQLVVLAFAQAFEVIPRQLCTNAGFDSIDILTQLRKRHATGEIWIGVDMSNNKIDNIAGTTVIREMGGVIDCMKAYIWEPSIVKTNLLAAATEAACTILSVDLTIKAASAANNSEMQSALPGVGPDGMPIGR